MRKSLLPICALMLALPLGATQLIPYEQFTLANGLRVIVNEDHKAPIVAIRVGYHVGGKDEPDGKTGFAHLFEHLMFKGSEHLKGSFVQTLDNAGATRVNAETTLDTTTYFETVPTPALELALWLESDRMGHFVNVITQPVLDTERSVVQNEKREREGGPLGLVNAREFAGLFSGGHPYARPVTGSMADLNAASVEDVRDWFREHYGAANTVVALSGDIDVRSARALMEKYFADVAAGPPLHHMQAWVPERSSGKREMMQARVPQMLVQRLWAIPGPQTRNYTMLEVAANIFNSTLNSRLRGELVEKRKLATVVHSSVYAYELSGVFEIDVSVKNGVDPAEVERVINEELSRFFEYGPASDELSKVKGDIEAAQTWSLQSVETKAELLLDGALFAGDPDFIERTARWNREANANEVTQAARQWLTNGYYQLTVQPFGAPQAANATVDRSELPAVQDTLTLKLPPISEATLSNGMKVVLAERREVPALRMTMVFANAGSDSDQGGKPGTSAATFALMSDGPTGLDRARYAHKLQELHAMISMDAGSRDGSSSLTVLKKEWPQALQLWASAIRDPGFRTTDIDRWRETELRVLQNARENPDVTGRRLLAYVLYPTGHPYAPRGDRVALVNALDVADFKTFHMTWVRPDDAKLFVVGDTSMPELLFALEHSLGSWKAPAAPLRSVPAIPLAPVPDKPRFILVDSPQSEQTTITATRFVLSARADGARQFTVANDILGGGLTARLSQRLRVEKGWAYDISSGTDGSLNQQSWSLSTSVQADKTVEAVVETLKVIENFKGAQPATAAELEQFVKSASRSIPGMFEDAGTLLAALVDCDAYGHPYMWMEGVKARLDAIQLDEVNRVAREYLTPHSFTWLLVGDVSKFEQKLRDTGLGDIEVWDRDGKRIR